MTQQRQDPGLMVLSSATTTADFVCVSYHHIASTPEGCLISRDENLGFVVNCGKESKAHRHVPTLSAAYAICQQLRPRSPDPFRPRV